MHFTLWLLAGLQFHKDMLIMRSYDYQDIKLRIEEDMGRQLSNFDTGTILDDLK